MEFLPVQNVAVRWCVGAVSIAAFRNNAGKRAAIKRIWKFQNNLAWVSQYHQGADFLVQWESSSMKIQSNFSAKCRGFLAVVCLTFASTPSASAAEKLFHLEVNEKNPGGKDLVINFEEVKREEKTSTVKVTMKSGASVPSTMFIMRGFYDLAQKRKMRYFIKLSEKQEQDGSYTTVMGFTNDKNINVQKYFKLDKPLPKKTEFEFSDVVELDMLFKW